MSCRPPSSRSGDMPKRSTSIVKSKAKKGSKKQPADPYPLSQRFLNQLKKIVGRVMELDFEQTQAQFAFLCDELEQWILNAQSGQEWDNTIPMVFELACLARRLGFDHGPFWFVHEENEVGVGIDRLAYTPPYGGVVSTVTLGGYMSDDKNDEFCCLRGPTPDDHERSLWVEHLQRWRRATGRRLPRQFVDHPEFESRMITEAGFAWIGGLFRQRKPIPIRTATEEPREVAIRDDASKPKGSRGGSPSSRTRWTPSKASQSKNRRVPKEPTRKVPFSKGMEWFKMARSTLAQAVATGAIAGKKISDRRWQFDLGDLLDQNPKAIPDADPSRNTSH